MDVIGLRGSALIDELQKPLHTGKLSVHYLPELCVSGAWGCTPACCSNPGVPGA